MPGVGKSLKTHQEAVRFEKVPSLKRALAALSRKAPKGLGEEPSGSREVGSPDTRSF